MTRPVVLISSLLCAFALAGGSGLSSLLRAAEKFQVLIISANPVGPHNWPAQAPVLKKQLEETGLFGVTTVLIPEDQVSTFTADWSQYQLVVMNYGYSVLWSEATRQAFEQYVSNGGGLISIHATTNAMAEWKGFSEMIGLGGWGGRDERCGPYVYYRDGAAVRDYTPGRAGAHGPREFYTVTVREPEHPIMKGLPTTWQHYSDELYYNMRGPAENMTILSTAFASQSQHDEPQMITVDYGRGRVFATMQGHDIAAMSSIGFVTVFQRAAEWAATGSVTQPVRDFPTNPDILAMRIDLARMDPNFGRPAAASGRGGRGEGPPAAQPTGRGAAAGASGTGAASAGGRAGSAPATGGCTWGQPSPSAPK